MKFHKKHTTVEAFQWLGTNVEGLKTFLGPRRFFQNGVLVTLATQFGDTVAGLKDWIIIDQGKILVEHDADFKQNYEAKNDRKTT